MAEASGLEGDGRQREDGRMGEWEREEAQGRAKKGRYETGDRRKKKGIEGKVQWKQMKMR